MEIAAAILAGGRAERLNGIAKGNLSTKKHVKIIHNIINELEKARLKNIVISANKLADYQEYQLPIIPDLRHGQGPLAGIESCLHYYVDKADAVLFVPCDLPYISAKEFSTLIDFYHQTKHPWVLARTQNGYQPLVAIIATKLLPAITEALNSKQYKIIPVWQGVCGEPNWQKCICEFPDERPFVNINSFAEMQAEGLYY